MSTNEISIEFLTENAVMLLWPEQIDDAQHRQIRHIQAAANERLNKHLIDSVVGYNSLVIYYHFEAIAPEALYAELETIIQRVQQEAQSNSHSNDTANEPTIQIPVLYNEIAGWDLANVAKRSGLTTDDVIQLHSQTHYRAYALGFMPGFCYLASIEDDLVLPRKPTPRLSVPAGAVAIAGNQTAVYPSTSPGGWHIIGQTPLQMYSLTPQFSPTISVGDTVCFKPITEDEFIKLGGLVAQEQQ